ncbi:HNH endonuclease [Rhizobium leguminosarum]|uniref:HNH endonuclease n=1 Tax=Rhizobium leguminosarum TaxID=384 RepID=UPI0019F8D0F5|nr:hypothetical protein [Rhizobium leguminosarum bv. viciae]
MACCFYCERPLNSRQVARRGDRNKGLDYTIDHKTPVSRGGSNERSNRVPCCFRCNQVKGDLTDVEFRQFVAVYGYERQPEWFMKRIKYDRSNNHGPGTLARS